MTDETVGPQTGAFLDRMVARSLERPLPLFAQYGLAVLVIAATALLRAALATDAVPWMLYIPGILGVALVTGRGPGLLAAALATVTGVLLVGSASNPAWLTHSQWISAVVFPITTGLLVLVTAELRASLRRAAALRVELVEREHVAHERETFMSSVLAASTDCIKVLELDGALSFMSEGGMRVMEVSDFNDVRGCHWPAFLKDDGAGFARDAIAAAKEGRASHFESYADTYQGTPKYWSVSVSPIRGPDGAVSRILSVSRDHTALADAREQQRLLNGELSHRLSNVLTLVQSIATQTLRGAASLEDAADALSARLASFGRATEVLTATAWRHAQLHAVAEAGLSAVSGMADRLVVSGPAVGLNSQAALALTLAIHELATNATKYGALSGEAGRVSLSWRVTGEGDDARLVLLWREEGGPPVAPPTRRGFGSRMIERALHAYFGGEVTLAFAPGGVEFRIDAPLQGVAAPTGER